MNKQIEIPETLYHRLAEHARGFEQPAEVITRILDAYETAAPQPEQSATPSSLSQQPTTTEQFAVKAAYTGKLEWHFYPSDLRQFKRRLLETKRAWVLLHHEDGSHDLRQWNANRFSESSDVKGNLSSGYLRGWRERGIVRADIAIDRKALDALV